MNQGRGLHSNAMAGVIMGPRKDACGVPHIDSLPIHCAYKILYPYMPSVLANKSSQILTFLRNGALISKISARWI